MITITIDHNNNSIKLDKLNGAIFIMHVNSTMEHKNFLIELLNMLNVSSVILEEINEDVRRTVDEW